MKKLLYILLFAPLLAFGQQSGSGSGTSQAQNIAKINGSGVDAGLTLSFGATHFDIVTIKRFTDSLAAVRSSTSAGAVLRAGNSTTGSAPYLGGQPPSYYTDIISRLGYTPYNATNPNGYISSFTETDPTVPGYAKTLTAFSVIKSSTDALYPTQTGGNASGTWGISITGNAATASNSGMLNGQNASYYYAASNPNGYISTFTETDPTVSSFGKSLNQSGSTSATPTYNGANLAGITYIGGVPSFNIAGSSFPANPTPISQLIIGANYSNGSNEINFINNTGASSSSNLAFTFASKNGNAGTSGGYVTHMIINSTNSDVGIMGRLSLGVVDHQIVTPNKIAVFDNTNPVVTYRSVPEFANDISTVTTDFSSGAIPVTFVTIIKSHDYIYTGGAGGAITLAPLSSVYYGRTYSIMIKNAGTGNVTISGTIYDTASVSSITLAPGNAVTLTPGPSSYWYTTSKY